MSPRILIVDDDAHLLRLLSLRLTGSGYTCLCASSGTEALAHMQTIRPDLVITDLSMPEMDGMQLFDRLHAQWPTLPVIILTAHGTIPDAVTATRRGVFGFVTKPFDAQNLLGEIRRALDLSRPPLPVRSGEVANNNAPPAFATRNPVVAELLAQARRLATTEVNVLIQGDSGTGKLRLAQWMHARSPRASQPCHIVHHGLLDDDQGIRTSDPEAWLRATRGGTLILHECTQLPLTLQTALERALAAQTRQTRTSGTRVIATTRQGLDKRIREGGFRADLAPRIAVAALAVPPLAERPEDIPLIAVELLRELDPDHSRALAPEALERLVQAHWRDNVRQLRHVLAQAIALGPGPLIGASQLERLLDVASDDLIQPFGAARRDFEREYLARLLRLTQGNVAQAARIAERNRTEFYKLIERHHLDPAAFREEDSEPS